MNSPLGSWCKCPRWWPWSSPPWLSQGSWSETAWSWTPCGTAGSLQGPGCPSSTGRCRVCRSGAYRPTWQAPGTGHSKWHMSGLLSGCLWKMWQQREQPWCRTVSSPKCVHTEETKAEPWKERETLPFWITRRLASSVSWNKIQHN